MVDDAAPLSFGELVAVSGSVAADRSRRRKAVHLAEAIVRLDAAERRIGLAYLAGRPMQERLGVGWRSLHDIDVDPAEHPTLRLSDVDETLERIAAAHGAGSVAQRRELLADLLGRATLAEQDFLCRLVMRELRQGALDAALVDAVAQATGVDADQLRERTMVAGDIVDVAAAVLEDGVDALQRFVLTPFRPVQPMLAQTASDVGEAMASLGGEAAIEVKVDGARIQVHRHGDEVRVYTRNLRDVTDQVPTVVQMVGALPIDDMVLDGEVIAMDDIERPLPFQATMGEFSTALEQGSQPERLRPFFFDVLRIDGADLLERSTIERVAHLDRFPGSMRIPRMVTTDADQARSFLADALAAGHEGVMAKALNAPYRAGRRGAAWLKIKPVHTLDLVVLAAEWGSGRRTGKLSNLHLGARQGDTFVMLGKTFKGLTDEVLEWQTEQLLARQTARRGHIVEVRPELVVEIAFDGVQASSRYPGGVTLRFARVKGYRPDRSADTADTLETVQAIHRGERLPPLPGS